MSKLSAGPVKEAPQTIRCAEALWRPAEDKCSCSEEISGQVPEEAALSSSGSEPYGNFEIPHAGSTAVSIS